MTVLERFWSLAVGMIGVLATLMRVAYVLGKILESLRKHVQQSALDHTDYETRLRALEHLRRR